MTNLIEPWMREYIENPERFWGAGHRQAKKLLKATGYLGERFSSPADLLRHLEPCLSERRRHAHPTLLVFSAGSSGSHWLKAMIKNAFGFAGCGEFYLPVGLHEMAAKDFLIIDLVQLVLSRVGNDALLANPIVNTTHSTAMLKIMLASSGVRSIFLCRNPVDIVISRTFRKTTYRLDKAPDASDAEYLDMNIGFVNRVLNSAIKSKFDLMVKYEDLQQDPSEALKRISEISGVYKKDSVLEKVAQEYMAENLLRRNASGNHFKGERPTVPNHLVDRTREKVLDIASLLGY